MNFIEAILKARKEAFKEHIRANAIILNEDFVKTRLMAYECFNGSSIIPPMICGMQVSITEDLPEEYAFALTDAPARRTEEERRIRKEEREKTIDELLTLANINIPPTVTNAQDYVDGFLYFFNMIKSIRDKGDGAL